MQPWQRYSVAVYMGLLLAGTLIAHPPTPAPAESPGIYLDPTRPTLDELDAEELPGRPACAETACPPQTP